MVRTGTIGGFKYSAPGSLEEALRILESEGTGCKVLAGGTDLVLQMKQGHYHPSLVVDVKRVPELNRLEWSREGGLHIGAAVPVSKILQLDALPGQYEVLRQACAVIGSVQIKNRGTIGGNICNAAPSADSAPPLLCLDARAELMSRRGSRTVDLDGFFTAPGKTVINPGELLVDIEIPAPPELSAGCYLRHTTREEMDISVASVASFVTASARNGTLENVRIALGAVAPTPVRARRAESHAHGKPVTKSLLEETSAKAAEEADPISDMRGSAEYRREMVRVLTKRTLDKACAQLGIKL